MAFFFQIAYLYLVRWEKHERRKNTEIVPFHLKASIRDESNNSTDVKCWFAISLIRKPQNKSLCATVVHAKLTADIYTRGWMNVCLFMYVYSLCVFLFLLSQLKIVTFCSLLHCIFLLILLLLCRKLIEYSLSVLYSHQI